MLLNMVMFKVTICDIGKMNINMTDKIEKKEATFAVPYNGEDNNDYVDGKGFCCNDGSLEAAQTRALARAAKNNFQEGDAYEKMQFYYHPDHLGSSSYITDLEGEVVQHIEYVPFGEVFIEWKISNGHYAKWKKNVGKSFKAPQIRIAPTHFNDGKRNMNAGKTRSQSTAVYGRTIFWKGTK